MRGGMGWSGRVRATSKALLGALAWSCSESANDELDSLAANDGGAVVDSAEPAGSGSPSTTSTDAVQPPQPVDTASPLSPGMSATVPQDAGASNATPHDAGNVPSEQPIVTEGEGDVVLEMSDASVCDRGLTFSTVALDEPPPFDVVIVADNSGSI